MKHHKKIYILVKGHEGEFARAVVVEDASVFVCKCAKAKYVGNGFIIGIGYKVGAAASLLSSLLLRMRPGMGGYPMGTGSNGVVSCAAFVLIVMLCRHFCGCFICPLDVAGLGMRYLQTIFAFKCGVPLRMPS